MFTRLHLEGFKSFREAELVLGPFTLLVGANASGKSNLRDAFRFLHGVGRGYTVAEILGEKWGEGGALQWSGIRGGARGVTFAGSDAFILELSFDLGVKPDVMYLYHVKAAVSTGGDSPRLVEERLIAPGLEKEFVFSDLLGSMASTAATTPAVSRPLVFKCARRFLLEEVQNGPPDITSRAQVDQIVTGMATLTAIAIFASMRFFDFSPDSLRTPSAVGQTTLGDRGENLPSVLRAICENANRKQELIRWLRELTPMDAVDLEFAEDPSSKVHLSLVEATGQRMPAAAASDGTLRFLGMLAALLGPNRDRFCIIEEIENGIHPTRLPLLLELFERVAPEQGVQIVATTHSPQLLAMVRPETLEHAALTYRLEGQPDAHVRRILDIPGAKEVLTRTDAGHLLATGWLENAVSFAEPVAEAG